MQLAVSHDGRLVYGDKQEKNVALGVITATTAAGDFIVKPYHFMSFAPDAHDGKTERYAHRNQEAQPPLTKHVQHHNTDLHLVPRENIYAGLQQVVLEETEISDPFFSTLARFDRQRDANAAAQQAGLPLPHSTVPAPVISAYQTKEYQVEDFLGKFIYYYDAQGSKYLAYAVGQQDGKVEVLLPDGQGKKLVAINQIRASSIVDIEGLLGTGISFITGSAYPLNHSVHWQDLRLPGARGSLWGAQLIHGAIVSLLDNGLLVVKTQLDNGNGLYLNYHLYLIHRKNPGILHFGNHHHRAQDK